MDSLSKKVLFVDLQNKTSETKTFPDLVKYMGGVGLGLKLYEIYQESDPIIFSVGPLNGFFPFVSKTSVVLKSENVVEDAYLGGYLSTRIKFCDLDAVVIHGKSSQGTVVDIHNEKVVFHNESIPFEKLGLPGKKSVLAFGEEGLLLDSYFTGHKNIIEDKLAKKGVLGVSFTGTNTFSPKNLDKYENIYLDLLQKTNQLSVERGFFPSCSGCPMGCEKSKTGELGGNVLVHSLVACGFAEKIYADVGTVFSCLNVLGYHYTHEDIENLPTLVKNTLKNLG